MAALESQMDAAQVAKQMWEEAMQIINAKPVYLVEILTSQKMLLQALLRCLAYQAPLMFVR